MGGPAGVPGPHYTHATNTGAPFTTTTAKTTRATCSVRIYYVAAYYFRLLNFSFVQYSKKKILKLCSSLHVCVTLCALCDCAHDNDDDMCVCLRSMVITLCVGQGEISGRIDRRLLAVRRERQAGSPARPSMSTCTTCNSGLGPLPPTRNESPSTRGHRSSPCRSPFTSQLPRPTGRGQFIPYANLAHYGLSASPSAPALLIPASTFSAPASPAEALVAD